MKTATKKVMNPAQVSQPSLEKVRMELKPVMPIAATRLKITVHAPWFDRALSAVETETMPAA